MSTNYEADFAMREAVQHMTLLKKKDAKAKGKER